MCKITLKFTHRHGRFCVCAMVVGTGIRHYRAVKELINPNFQDWDQELQRFTTHDSTARQNNRILSKIISELEDILRENEFQDGNELFRFQKRLIQSEAKKDKSKNNAKSPYITIAPDPATPIPLIRNSETKTEITLGEWINQIIAEIKKPTRLKPSSSYQGYLTLLHKLEYEGWLIKQPVSSLGDESFVRLISWLNSTKRKDGKGNNYIGVMKMYTATLNRARKARLTTYRPDYPYMNFAPVHHVTDNAKDFLTNGGAVKSLTDEQFDKFVNMDLRRVPMKGGVKIERYKELYRDFTILLYELKSRPIDVLRLHWDNIAYDETQGRFTCTYIPAKKKNYGASSRHTSKALVIQYLSKRASDIILKYKGQSKGGYIFPFTLNNRKWNFDKPDDFHYHYAKGNRICGRINNFLHKVGEGLNIPFQLTLYAFRRSAITHAIIENKIPLAMLAKMAGTSVEMIEEHYANYLHALAAY